MLRRRLTACNQHRPHTRTLRHIRPLLTLEAAQAVAVSIVEGADSTTATSCSMVLLSGTLIDFSGCKNSGTCCLPSFVVSQCTWSLMGITLAIDKTSCSSWRPSLSTLSTLVCRRTSMMTYTWLLASQNAPVFHCTSASTTSSTHFCCILFLHHRCTYCVCKHSICWQLCETRIWTVCIYLRHLG